MSNVNENNIVVDVSLNTSIKNLKYRIKKEAKINQELQTLSFNNVVLNDDDDKLNSIGIEYNACVELTTSDGNVYNVYVVEPILDGKYDNLPDVKRFGLKRAFKFFDRKHTGFITVEKFTHIMTKLGKKINKEYVDEMIKEVLFPIPDDGTEEYYLTPYDVTRKFKDDDLIKISDLIELMIYNKSHPIEPRLSARYCTTELFTQ